MVPRTIEKCSQGLLGVLGYNAALLEGPERKTGLGLGGEPARILVVLIPSIPAVVCLRVPPCFLLWGHSATGRQLQTGPFRGDERWGKVNRSTELS